jgi:hypothetical protein
VRTTIVPAQITTVEDKIAGNLGISQLLLLITPVFLGSAMFAVLPPFLGSAPYKLVLLVCLAALCGTLAIRIKGKILLLWIVVVVRYNIRPKYYLFNKNDTHLRDMPQEPKTEEREKNTATQEETYPTLAQLPTAEVVKIEGIIANPQANLHFKTNRKGKLSVRVTEVK